MKLPSGASAIVTQFKARVSAAHGAFYSSAPTVPAALSKYVFYQQQHFQRLQPSDLW